MKKLLLIISSLLFVNVMLAQQIPQYRHHLYYNFYHNPAYAFSKDKPEILINHRSQWVGFEGAPTTSGISGSYQFLDDMAGGLIISNDLIGATKHLLMNLSYAYQLKLNKDWNINFGLSWTFMQSQIDGSKVDLYDNTDQLVTENVSGKSWKPDANAGIMINSQKYMFGLSAMQLFQSKYRLYDKSDAGINAVRHYFLTGNAKFDAGSNLVLNTGLLFEFAGGVPERLDLLGNLEFNDSFIAGLNYSLKDAISLNAGYKYKQFVFFYTYDITVSKLMSVASGAHELTIGYNLIKKTSTNYRPSF